MLWAVAFLVYPLLSFLLHFDEELTNAFAPLISYQKLHSITFISIAGVVLTFELLLNLSGNSRIPSKFSEWILHLNIPRLVLISLALFALLLPWISTYFQKKITTLTIAESTGWYLYYAVQIFIIYGTYYFYYHIHHHILFNQLLKEKGLLYYVLGLLTLLLILTPVSNQFIALFPVVHDLKIHTIGLTTSIFDDLNYTIPIGVLVLTFPLILLVEWFQKAKYR